MSPATVKPGRQRTPRHIRKTIAGRRSIAASLYFRPCKMEDTMRRREPISPRLAALIHGAVVGGDTGFFLLSVGERFRFPQSDDVYTKTSDRGWYKDSAGRKWRTGTATAVIRVMEATP